MNVSHVDQHFQVLFHRIGRIEDQLLRLDRRISEIEQISANNNDNKSVEVLDSVRDSLKSVEDSVSFFISDFTDVDESTFDESIDRHWTGNHRFGFNRANVPDILINGGLTSDNDYGMIFKSSNFDGYNGFYLDTHGNLAVRNITASELRVEAFIADVQRAHAGSIIATKSMALLSQSVTVPALNETFTITVADLPGFSGLDVFAPRDYLKAKVIDRSAGLQVVEVWMQVIDRYVLSGSESGSQSWIVKHVHSNSAERLTLESGATIIDLGNQGDGIWRAKAFGSFAPFSEIAIIEAESPWEDQKVIARMGNLSGISDPEFPLIEGFGIYATRGYLSKDVEIAGSLRAKQVTVGNLTLDDTLDLIERQNAERDKSLGDYEAELGNHSDAIQDQARELASHANTLSAYGESIDSHGNTLSAYEYAISEVKNSAAAANNAANQANHDIHGINTTIIGLSGRTDVNDAVSRIINAWSVKDNNITYLDAGILLTKTVMAHHLNIGGYVSVDEHRMLIGDTVALDNDGISLKGLDWTYAPGQSFNPALYDANKLTWKVDGAITSEMYGGNSNGTHLTAIQSISNGKPASLVLEASRVAGLGQPSTGLSLFYSGNSSDRAILSVGGAYKMVFTPDGIQFYDDYVLKGDNGDFLKVKAPGGEARYIPMQTLAVDSTGVLQSQLNTMSHDIYSSSNSIMKRIDNIESWLSLVSDTTSSAHSRINSVSSVANQALEWVQVLQSQVDTLAQSFYQSRT